MRNARCHPDQHNITTVNKIKGIIVVIFALCAPQVPSHAQSTDTISDSTSPVPVAGRSWTNSQGVKFVPAGTDGILFGIWDVRVKDYAAFVKETGYVWPKSDFSQTENEPAVNVSWNDAQAFCQWLSKKEQTEGSLAPNQKYRLPSDTEWSKAVGLDEGDGGTPMDKDMQIKDVYPWSAAGSSSRAEEDYVASLVHVGYANTTPVGSYAANKYGLYDMGNNVWQWCEDKFAPSSPFRVFRGNTWFYCSRSPMGLPSSFRGRTNPGDRATTIGFRMVLPVSP